MIGLSLSLCIADICQGDVRLEDVEKIVTRTAFKNEEEFTRLIASYRRAHWDKFADEAERIFRQLRAEGKIFQPRLSEDPWCPNIYHRHWVASEDDIVKHSGY